MALVVCYIELEDGSGHIALEVGPGAILLEDDSCPQPQPAVSPTPIQGTTQGIIPAYPYQQYIDDDNISAFFAAYNTIAQSYLNWFNAVQLGDYRQLTGPLLDWIAEGLYGIRRPALPSGSLQLIGPLNTWAPNTITLNTGYTLGSISTFAATDDIFKRIIAWFFFKGDGQQFSVLWLKRRVMRFLTQPNGTALNIGQEYPIGVTFDVDAEVTITITLTVMAGISLMNAQILQAAILSGAVSTPFQFNFNVVIVNNLAPTNLTNAAGVLHITDAIGWPVSAMGLPDGAVWADGGSGGIVTVVPGVTPNPFAAPLIFGLITSAELLTLGGGNLPLSDPHAVDQLWNNSNVVTVSAG